MVCRIITGRGDPAGAGTPVHPTHKLSDKPAVFEFATPIAGTYSPWYNSIYWNEGAKICYSPSDFYHAAIRNAHIYSSGQEPIVVNLDIESPEPAPVGPPPQPFHPPGTTN